MVVNWVQILQILLTNYGYNYFDTQIFPRSPQKCVHRILQPISQIFVDFVVNGIYWQTFRY